MPDYDGFRTRMRALMDERGMSFRVLAARTYISKTALNDITLGHRVPDVTYAALIDEVLGADGELVNLVTLSAVTFEDEITELTRRLRRSSLSPAALTTLEEASSRMAENYELVDPREHLERCREHLRLIAGNIGVGAVPPDRRVRLSTAGGYLALVTADLSRHLGNFERARALEALASRFGRDAGSPTIRSWALVFRGWTEFGLGRLTIARRMAGGAVAVAPHGSQVRANAIADLACMAARQGDHAAATVALNGLRDATEGLPVKASTDLFAVNQTKVHTATATTLALIGDPRSVELARQSAESYTVAAPRRAAAQRLSMAIGLVATGDVHEAVNVATAALRSGNVTASSSWKARVLVSRVGQVPGCHGMAQDLMAMIGTEPGTSNT